MKRRIQLFYIGIALVAAMLLNVIMIHMLLAERENNMQENVESRLPMGNHLPDAENPLMRVVIKTNGFKQIVHNQVQISAAHGLNLQSDTTEDGEIITITPDHELFQSGSIRIAPKTDEERITIHSITRGYGTPSYRGSLELFSTVEGIVIVNELPVEEYLYAVVPSEMPASYEMEALKCQAICARSYAYCQMRIYGYPEYYAHVDDSVSYQVYGNSREQESTTQAVNETSGKKLWYHDQVVKTYYYSTSSGHSTSVEAWGSTLTDSNKYLKGVPIRNEQGVDYEAHLPWYRWEAVIPSDTLCNIIELNTEKDIGDLENVEITKKGTGGIALQITVTGTAKTITIETENKIRKTLGGSGYQITKQDGTVIKSSNLLPSAFFSIEKNGKSYIIKGGGYGHGIGMSQNGANEIAKNGKTHEEILQLFYPGTQVR